MESCSQINEEEVSLLNSAKVPDSSPLEKRRDAVLEYRKRTICNQTHTQTTRLIRSQPRPTLFHQLASGRSLHHRTIRMHRSIRMVRTRHVLTRGGRSATRKERIPPPME